MPNEAGAAGAPVAPAGGAAAGGAGGASAGAGGEGGQAPVVAKALSCANQCEVDDDCKIGDSVGQQCNQTTKRCYDGTVAACTTNEDCVPAGSGWFVTCASDADCAQDDTESCVASGAVGYCALLSVGDACDVGEPQDRARFGAQGTSNVCVAFDRCQEGVCKFNCADPLFGGFCEAGNGNFCNAATGECECQQGNECDSGVCGGDAHCAQCATSNDCINADVAGWQVCVNGKCGCTDATTCPDMTANATPVCE